MSDADESNFGRQFRERQQREIARLALAGLKRPAYSGVLLDVPNRKHSTWKGDLLLDGYNRHLTITVCRMRDKRPTGEMRFQNWGRITGLWPFFQRRDFELIAADDHVSDPRLKARIDLQVAVLNISIFFCAGVNGDKLKIALLEVLRASLAGPDSHPHPS
ncbi:hypothetical protein [Roseovarius aquimarinus]|uniref:Uncharacterized protein n=1 Tax=Roseovarius aquimarinus TaxID=1229156 RepID=A0ABW7I282_9RHOB